MFAMMVSSVLARMSGDRDRIDAVVELLRATLGGAPLCEEIPT
jgi:hypothetical protein